MKTERWLLLVIAAVLGALGWQTYRQLAAGGATPAPTTRADAAIAAGALKRPAADPASAALAAEAAPTPLAYGVEGMRDPFANLLPREVDAETAPRVALPALRLQGLVYGQLKPRAIIDGRVVGEGDRFDDIEVLQIQREGVLLTYRNQRFFLKAGQKGALKPQGEGSR